MTDRDVSRDVVLVLLLLTVLTSIAGTWTIAKATSSLEIPSVKEVGTTGLAVGEPATSGRVSIIIAEEEFENE